MYFCRFACLFVSSLSSHLVVGTQVLCPNLHGGKQSAMESSLQLYNLKHKICFFVCFFFSPTPLCVCISCSCLSWQRRIPTVRGTVSSPSSGFAKSFPVFFFSIFFPGFMLVLPGFVLVLSSLPGKHN